MDQAEQAGDAEAESQQLIRISDPEALPIADQMFPKFEPFITDVDRF